MGDNRLPGIDLFEGTEERRFEGFFHRPFSGLSTFVSKTDKGEGRDGGNIGDLYLVEKVWVGAGNKVGKHLSGGGSFST